MEIRYAKSGDAHLAYRIDGDAGPDLVAIDAYTISIDSVDDEPRVARFHRRLASFGRVIRFDFRGVGLSDPVDPAVPPTVARMAADVLAVCDAAGVGRTWLLAHSGTGAVGIELAAAAPDRVLGLVLAGTYARLVRADDYPIGFRSEVVQAFLDENLDPDAQWQAAGGDDVALIAPSLRDDLQFREWWSRGSRRGASPRAARVLLEANVWADVRARLPEITVPTLVLHRQGDSFVPAAHGRYIARHVPGARFVELPGADHLVWVGDSDAVLDEIELFVTGEVAHGSGERVLTTVLFTDIADSTALAADLGDRRWTERLDAHDATVREQLARFGGREVHTTGDGFMAAFDSPTQAVRCAQAIVAAAERTGVRVRAGLHTGECERRGADLAGLAVHIAARVAQLAPPGGVLVTRTVRDLVTGADLRFEDRGGHELKGIAESWHLFAAS